jgi:hypothetical protein
VVACGASQARRMPGSSTSGSSMVAGRTPAGGGGGGTTLPELERATSIFRTGRARRSWHHARAVDRDLAAWANRFDMAVPRDVRENGLSRE